eukprot:TRINITY_DN5900_c0_g2_i1.p1 TRINITY_DN5900_c0_g2~~TRINITY_DN5900_c0_g2_i1.p1  ORF type:complete len:412 (+),score=90.21 TRINITY_DN5900_c0_g2_i1:39-1274(+)
MPQCETKLFRRIPTKLFTLKTEQKEFNKIVNISTLTPRDIIEIFEDIIKTFKKMAKLLETVKENTPPGHPEHTKLNTVTSQFNGFVKKMEQTIRQSELKICQKILTKSLSVPIHYTKSPLLACVECEWFLELRFLSPAVRRRTIRHSIAFLYNEGIIFVPFREREKQNQPKHTNYMYLYSIRDSLTMEHHEDLVNISKVVKKNETELSFSTCGRTMILYLKPLPCVGQDISEVHKFIRLLQEKCAGFPKISFDINVHSQTNPALYSKLLPQTLTNMSLDTRIPTPITSTPVKREEGTRNLNLRSSVQAKKTSLKNMVVHILDDSHLPSPPNMTDKKLTDSLPKAIGAKQRPKPTDLQETPTRQKQMKRSLTDTKKEQTDKPLETDTANPPHPSHSSLVQSPPLTRSNPKLF